MLLKLVPANTTINFVRYGKVLSILSFLAVVAIAGLLLTKGLNMGIDFTGGIVMELRTEKKAPISQFRDIITKEKFGNVSIQSFGSENDVMIRFQVSEDKKQVKVIEDVKILIMQNIDDKIDYRKIDYVGPQVGKELIRSGIMAMSFALLAMMMYLWIRFDFQYGVGGVITLFHDAVIVVGFFILSGLEFNLTSLAAVLTTIGYSINDTVVTYDRIRENLRKYRKKSMSEIINLSVNATLSRTILTSGTTILAVLCLVMFGGEVLKGFSLAILVGVVVGTYSSVYVATLPLLYIKITNE